jgi:hypothetical protein
MARSDLPFEGTTVTAPGQGSAASPALVQPFDNTDSLLIYNASLTEAVVIKIRTAPVSDANDPDESTYLPADSAITLPLGDVSSRPPYGTEAGQQSVYYSTTSPAGTAAVKITHLNNLDR